MNRVVRAKPLQGFNLWVRFEDGASGDLDISDLAGRGVFRAWEDRRLFESVRISESGAVEWPGGVDLGPDALYLRLTGKQPEELFPALRAVRYGA